MELGNRTVTFEQFGVIWETERQPKSTGLPCIGTGLAAARRRDTCRTPPSSSWGKEISVWGFIPGELRCENCLPLFETDTTSFPGMSTTEEVSMLDGVQCVHEVCTGGRTRREVAVDPLQGHGGEAPPPGQLQTQRCLRSKPSSLENGSGEGVMLAGSPCGFPDGRL